MCREATNCKNKQNMSQKTYLFHSRILKNQLAPRKLLAKEYHQWFLQILYFLATSKIFVKSQQNSDFKKNKIH